MKRVPPLERERIFTNSIQVKNKLIHFVKVLALQSYPNVNFTQVTGTVTKNSFMPVPFSLASNPQENHCHLLPVFACIGLLLIGLINSFGKELP